MDGGPRCSGPRCSAALRARGPPRSGASVLGGGPPPHSSVPHRPCTGRVPVRAPSAPRPRPGPPPGSALWPAPEVARDARQTVACEAPRPRSRWPRPGRSPACHFGTLRCLTIGARSRRTPPTSHPDTSCAISDPHVRLHAHAPRVPRCAPRPPDASSVQRAAKASPRTTTTTTTHYSPEPARTAAARMTAATPNSPPACTLAGHGTITFRMAYNPCLGLNHSSLGLSKV